jgi:hypothetical protein
MADDQIPVDVDRTIDASLGDTAPKKRSRKKKQKSYQVIGTDSKIPVAKSTGKVWKSRLSQGKQHVSTVSEAWSEAIRYYNNDQLGHRRARENASGNEIGNQRLNSNITETENVVFANITTMVPALYARNPEAEITANDESQLAIATMVERLVNVIGNRKTTPGINLKRKAKRGVVTTLLTNRSWMKIGYTNRGESSEQALEELTELSLALDKAKDAKTIVEIEGKIQALEETIDILQPSGPWAKIKSPFQIIVDPEAKEIDLSDARWVMEEDMLPTEYLLARYASKVGDEYKSLFQPSHVIKMNVENDSGDIETNQENFSIFEESEKDTAKTFGFDDEHAFNKAKMTKVYFVWDKTTRRVLLFNSKDWSWPIWVWDDPNQLDQFFPYYPLTFFESPEGPLTKGEVTYYLDQQDAINEITDEQRRWRKWTRRNIFFNETYIDEAQATAILNGDDGTVRGLKLPEGVEMNKHLIGSIAPPSMQFDKMFDKEATYRAIDRISSVSEVMRGAQFKTNTNTSAVDANVGASNMRVDEKSDEIEDWIGNIYWGIAQLCLMNMPKETVVELIGEEAGAQWDNLTPVEIRKMSYKIVGGSTKKPTSQAKKEEALEFGQVLGQFVQAAPGPTIKIMLQVMEKAFDEVTMKEEDWKELSDAIMQQAGQEPPPGQGQPGGEGDIETASPDQLKQLVEQLPPDAKQEVQAAIQSGVSPKEALKAALQQMAASQEQTQTPPQQLQ